MLVLTDCIGILDRIPAWTDLNGEVIKAGDLVAIRCKDEQDQEYDHYGVLEVTPHGLSVAHFFTGRTVKPGNTLSETGWGYIHQLPYDPAWIVQEHLSLNGSSYAQVEERINNSRKDKKRLWKKLTYNCEHWAREMFSGEPTCTQSEKFKEEFKEELRRKRDGMVVDLQWNSQLDATTDDQWDQIAEIVRQEIRVGEIIPLSDIFLLQSDSMNSSVTKTFRKKLEGLPLSVQKKAAEAYELWQLDPSHRSLQFKQVSLHQPIYSFQISLNHLAFGLREDDYIYWFWIGEHSEYEELLKRP